ncbi:hypothetical protein NPIL_568231 [Nephila pilipes]|uniref:Uncharacterized protein n=1 Tax=Nephila pilipes TaxID=299642 RepID=A0A8X6MEH6_NEPPI|nr:hypothetical protein NPIL_568231 [Nephila pilipes]
MVPPTVISDRLDVIAGERARQHSDTEQMKPGTSSLIGRRRLNRKVSSAQRDFVAYKLIFSFLLCLVFALTVVVLIKIYAFERVNENRSFMRKGVRDLHHIGKEVQGKRKTPNTCSLVLEPKLFELKPSIWIIRLQRRSSMVSFAV